MYAGGEKGKSECETQNFEDFRAYQDYQGGPLMTFVQEQSMKAINTESKSVIHSTIKTNQEELPPPLVIARKQTNKISFKLKMASPREQNYDSPIGMEQRLRSASEIQSPIPYQEYRKSKTLANPIEADKQLQAAEILSLIEQSKHSRNSSLLINETNANLIPSPDRLSSITENRRQTTVFGQNVSTLEILISILRKNQRYRTERDLNRLLPLVKTIKFFKEFVVEQDTSANGNTEQDKNLKEIVSCLTYEFVPKDCNVFEYGSQGDKFYILLEGEVGVLIPKSNDYNYSEVRKQIEDMRLQLAEREQDLVDIQEALVEEKLLNKFKQIKRQDPDPESGLLSQRLKLSMEKHFIKMMVKEKTGIELIEEREQEPIEEKPAMDSLFEALKRKITRSQKKLLHQISSGGGREQILTQKELFLRRLNDHFKSKLIQEGTHGSKDQTFISEVCVKVSMLPDYSCQELKDLIIEEISYLEDQLKNHLFIQVTTLEQGMSFGELALNNNQPRAATITCREDCHFAVMVKGDYQKCLQTITKKHLQTILDFLRELPFIKHGMSSRSQLIKLQFNLHKKEFKRGQYVTKEGDASEYVYIIIKGEFEVTKKVTIKCEDKREQALQQEAVSAGQTSNLEAVLRLKQSEQYQLNFFRPRKRLQPLQAKMVDSIAQSRGKVKIEIRQVKITILGSGQIFGEQDVMIDRELSSLSLRCISTEGELFQMSKEDFIKRFKPGCEPYKILLSMGIAKEKAVQEKVQRATGLNIQSQDGKTLAKLSGNASPTLKESAGLKPSQPDYYDIRQSMKKIIDLNYTNESLISRHSSPNNMDRSHFSGRHRTNSTFENTRNLLSDTSALQMKTFGGTKGSFMSAKKVIQLDKGSHQKDEMVSLLTQPEICSEGTFPAHKTEVGGEVISTESNFLQPNSKRSRGVSQPYKIKLNMTDDISTQPSNREAALHASAILRESGQYLSDWSSMKQPRPKEHPGLFNHKSIVDNLQPLVRARRVSFVGDRQRELLQPNPYEQMKLISERRQKKESNDSKSTEMQNEYPNIESRNKTQECPNSTYGFPQVAQQTWRGFDQKEFQNLLMNKKSVQQSQVTAVSRRRKVSSYHQDNSRNHVYQGVACTFQSRNRQLGHGNNTFMSARPIILLK